MRTVYEFKMQHRGVAYQVAVGEDASVRLDRQGPPGGPSVAWLTATLADRQLVDVTAGSRTEQRRGRLVWLPPNEQLLETLLPALLKALLRQQPALLRRTEAVRNEAARHRTRYHAAAAELHERADPTAVKKIDAAAAKVAAAELKLRQVREQHQALRTQYSSSARYIYQRDQSVSAERRHGRVSTLLAELDKLAEQQAQPEPVVSATVALPEVGIGLLEL